MKKKKVFQMLLLHASSLSLWDDYHRFSCDLCVLPPSFSCMASARFDHRTYHLAIPQCWRHNNSPILFLLCAPCFGRDIATSTFSSL
uniref:Secreted protein n=1 Tax=Ixodes ricinus TaxID=34613 RepID=A0A6B0UFG0_IXORI